MSEVAPSPLTPSQIAKLERLLRAGFKFVTFERFARYPAVEKDGFVALLDTAQGEIRIFGQVGYRIGEGIGVLVKRARERVFVWKRESVKATPELLKAYDDFRAELKQNLEGTPSSHRMPKV